MNEKEEKKKNTKKIRNKKDNVNLSTQSPNKEFALMNNKEALYRKKNANSLKKKNSEITAKQKKSKFVQNKKDIHLTPEEKKELQRKKTKRKIVESPISVSSYAINNKIKEVQNEVEKDDSVQNAAYLKMSKMAQKKVSTVQKNIGQKKDQKTEREILEKRNKLRYKSEILTEKERKRAQKQRLKKLYNKRIVYQEAEKQGIFPSRKGRRIKEKKENRIFDNVVSVAVWIFIIGMTLTLSFVFMLATFFLIVFLGLVNTGNSVWDGTNDDIDKLEYDWLYKEATIRRDIYDSIETVKEENGEDYTYVIEPNPIQVSHSIFVLMSYYSAKYEKIDYDTIKPENDELISIVYPASPGYTYEISSENPNVIIITFEVSFASLENEILSRMNEEQKSAYDRYLFQNGGKQCYSQPVDDWGRFISEDPHYGCWFNSNSDEIENADYMCLRSDELIGKPVYAMAKGKIKKISVDDNGIYTIEADGQSYEAYKIYGLTSVYVTEGSEVDSSSTIGVSGSQLYIWTKAKNQDFILSGWHNPEYLIR